MTNYNERLNEIFYQYRDEYNAWQANPRGSGTNGIKLQNRAKQAIIKLIEDEAREAVWKEKERIYEFATRKQANGLYVPIELGIEPWLREQL